jgi:anti-sigma factor RsiW
MSELGMHMLDCKQRAKVSAYYDNELAGAQKAEMEAHLAGCGRCRAELAALGALSGRLSAMKTPAVAKDMGARIRERLAAQEERGLLHVAEAMMGIAAAIMIAALVGIRMMNNAVATEPNPDWAVAAQHPSEEVAGAGNRETVLAQWIVDDLSMGDSQ